MENFTLSSSVYSESRVRLSAKNVILFYTCSLPLFLLLLNIFTIFLFTIFCFVWLLLHLLSLLADQIKKNHASLPTTERGAAELISRFVEYIRVARLLAPGARFLSIVVVHRIVLSVVSFLSSRVALSSSSRIVLFFSSHIAVFVYRLVFLVATSLRFVYGHASINELFRSSRIVSILRFKIVDGSFRNSAVPRAIPSSQYIRGQ